MPIQVELKDETFYLVGEINFANVDGLHNEVLSIINAKPTMTRMHFDFNKVTHSDSSGLALVLVLLKYSEQHHIPIKISSLLPNLLAIAKASRLDKLMSSALMQ